MPLHVFNSINLEMNKWNWQSRLWRNTKECIFSENSCLKNFLNFQEIYPSEIAFLNKVAGCLTWGIFFWEIYEIFRTGLTRNTHECRLLQLVVAGKCFDRKIFLKKYIIRFDIQWHVLPGIKCITDIWRPFMMFILVCTCFVWFTSLRALFIWTSGKVTSIVLITHTVIFSKQEVSKRWV